MQQVSALIKQLHNATYRAKRSGFTIVELLVTVAIMLLVATIALSRFVTPDPQEEFDQGMQTIMSQFELMRTYSKSVKQCCTDEELSRPPYPDAGYAMVFYYPTDEAPEASKSYLFYADGDTPESYYSDKYSDQQNNCPPEGCSCGPDGCPDEQEPYTGQPFAYEPEGFDTMFYQGDLPYPLEFSDCTTFGFNLSDFFTAFSEEFPTPECQIYIFRRPEEGFSINDAGNGPEYIDVVFQHQNHPEIKGTIRIFNMITTMENLPGQPEIPFSGNPYQDQINAFYDYLAQVQN